MLANPDPAPTGLITALLGRARVLPSAITAEIGPSPRQMRELTEGRGLFSPFKLGRVAALTGVPETAIRAAMGQIPEMIEALDLPVGSLADHPRLGRCDILKTGRHLTIRTEKGVEIEGVHPVSFANSDLLDRFGLTPESGLSEGPDAEPAMKAETKMEDPGPDNGKTVPKPVVKENLTAPKMPDAELSTETTDKASSRSDAPPEPDRAPDIRAGTQDPHTPESDTESELKEDKLMRDEPDREPDPTIEGSGSHETATALAPDPERAGESGATDPRDLLRGLVERSGRSQAAMSRALGKDPSFLNAILKRGRSVPDGLLDRVAALCEEPTPHVSPEAAAVKVETEEPPKSVPSHIVAAAEKQEAGSADSPETEASDEVAASLPAQENGSHEGPVKGRIFVLQPTPPGPEAEMMEVVIDGVCRVRVPAGFDMDAAARLIRSVSTGLPAMSGAR